MKTFHPYPEHSCIKKMWFAVQYYNSLLPWTCLLRQISVHFPVLFQPDSVLVVGHNNNCTSCCLYQVSWFIVQYYNSTLTLNMPPPSDLCTLPSTVSTWQCLSGRIQQQLYELLPASSRHDLPYSIITQHLPWTCLLHQISVHFLVLFQPDSV